MNLNDKFKLLDKVRYDFVNYDKPLGYPPMTYSGSGCPCPNNNDFKIGVIKEIKTIKSKYYIFEYDDYNDINEGEHESETIEYFITGHDKPLQSYQIKKI